MDPLEPTLADRVAALAVVHLRPVATVIGYPGPTRTLVFDPPLTTEEQATYADLVAIAKSQEAMTPTLYAEVRSQMQTLRALRQLGRNAFMAQTAAERDRATYDALVAVTQVFLAILRA